MKRILFIAVVLLLGAMQLNAQNTRISGTRVGYINTETILSRIPEYKIAQDKLEALSNQYKEKMDAEVKKIEALYQSYQSSKASLNEYQRSQRENDIITKERNVKEQQKAYFGQEGIMQQKSEELLNPVKSRVQQAIDRVAKEGNYMLIFDIAAMQGIAYSNDADNLSGLVLKTMGINL